MGEQELINKFISEKGVTELKSLTNEESINRVFDLVFHKDRVKYSWAYRKPMVSKPPSSFIQPDNLLPVKHSPSWKKAVADFYEEGWTVLQCAKAFHTGPSVVREVVRGEGRGLRPQGSPAKMGNLDPPDRSGEWS